MQYVRVYADADGTSHFADETVALRSTNYAPPAPAMLVSSVFPTTGAVLVCRPVGWTSNWHRPPARQLAFVLSGQSEMETSDGAVRCFQAGQVLLVEATTGKGIRSRVRGNEDVLLAFVQLAASA